MGDLYLSSFVNVTSKQELTEKFYSEGAGVSAAVCAGRPEGAVRQPEGQNSPGPAAGGAAPAVRGVKIIIDLFYPGLHGRLVVLE